jgi:hypothetical protein
MTKVQLKAALDAAILAQGKLAANAAADKKDAAAAAVTAAQAAYDAAPADAVKQGIDISDASLASLQKALDDRAAEYPSSNFAVTGDCWGFFTDDKPNSGTSKSTGKPYSIAQLTAKIHGKITAAVLDMKAWAAAQALYTQQIAAGLTPAEPKKVYTIAGGVQKDLSQVGAIVVFSGTNLAILLEMIRVAKKAAVAGHVAGQKPQIKALATDVLGNVLPAGTVIQYE